MSAERSGRSGAPDPASGSDSVDVDLDAVQQQLGLRFLRPSSLRAAFVHESFANENPLEKSNERLEFLGDAVVGMAASALLYERFPELPEGELTRMKAMLVSRPSLAAHARSLDLGAHLLISRGGEAHGERERASLLADVFEAVVGALYLDRGWSEAEAFVRQRFEGSLEALPETDRNYKSILQQITQKHFKSLPEYRVVRLKGPAHARSFVVEVWFRQALLGSGEGRSKKEAQQEAARKGLERVHALLPPESGSAGGAGQGSGLPSEP